MPPRPPDTNKNDSWKGSSSDSDINNSTNTAKLHGNTALDLFTCDTIDPDTLGSSHGYTSKLMQKGIKITRKRKTLQRNESKVISKGIISKKTTPKIKIQVGKI